MSRPHRHEGHFCSAKCPCEEPTQSFHKPWPAEHKPRQCYLQGHSSLWKEILRLRCAIPYPTMPMVLFFSSWTGNLSHFFSCCWRRNRRMSFAKNEQAVIAYSARELLKTPFAFVKTISSLSVIAGHRI